MRRSAILFVALAALGGCTTSEGNGDALTAADAPAMLTDGGTTDLSAVAAPADLATGCPSEMVPIDTFCVDRYEAYVVELDGNGNETPHSPFAVVDQLKVRAKSAAGVMPQGYISQLQATAACAAAGKRLCSPAEFAVACRGPDAANDYPYGGTTHQPGNCNEGKGSSMARFFGNNASLWTYAEFNDPILNQWDGGLAPTGSYPKCVSPAGVADCVGNLHEWGNDPADTKGHGRFRGGFYGDAESIAPGCLYVTSAHDVGYHDYSTGFRCCADVR